MHVEIDAKTKTTLHFHKAWHVYKHFLNAWIVEHRSFNEDVRAHMVSLLLLSSAVCLCMVPKVVHGSSSGQISENKSYNSTKDELYSVQITFNILVPTKMQKEIERKAEKIIIKTDVVCALKRFRIIIIFFPFSFIFVYFLPSGPTYCSSSYYLYIMISFCFASFHSDSRKPCLCQVFVVELIKTMYSWFSAS